MAAGLIIFLFSLEIPPAFSAKAAPGPKEYLTIEEAEAAKKTPQPEDNLNEEIDVHIIDGHHFEKFSAADQEAIVKYLVTENIAKLPGYNKASRTERKKKLSYWTSASSISRMTNEVRGRYRSGKFKKADYVIAVVQKVLSQGRVLL